MLVARTLWFVTPRQAFYLPIRRLQRAFPAQSKRTGQASHAANALGLALLTLGPRDAEYMQRADDVVRRHFRFLNHAEDLPKIDWRRRYDSHLWSFNLHYFDYALDLAWAHLRTAELRYVNAFRELATGWIGATTDRRGDAWQPYTISLRVVNWIQALLLFGDALPADVAHMIRGSIHDQLAALERRIEWHLLANHLQKNLQALYTGGLFFAGADASRWRKRWGPRLWAEIEAQVLADGTQFERSPMYHAIALGDVIETIAFARAVGEQVPELVVQRAQRMTRALGVLSRPNGMLHLFNDAAEGIAPPVSWLSRAGEQVLGQPVSYQAGPLSLPSAGYYGFHAPERGDRFVIDCGELGPDYQPGHAHCDLLSYELDLDGIPLVVDSGVSGYDGDPLREYMRSTRAHNTVSVEGRDQHEMWGTFRVARRARPGPVAQGLDEESGYRFQGSYSPYWSPSVRHERTATRGAAGIWRIADRITGTSTVRLESFVHLNPTSTVLVRGLIAEVRIGTRAWLVEFFGVDRITVVRGSEPAGQSWYSPAFGGAGPSPCIIAQVQSYSGGEFGYSIKPLTRGEP